MCGICVSLLYCRAAFSFFLHPLFLTSCRSQVNCPEQCPIFWNCLFAYHLHYFFISHIYEKWTLEAWLHSSLIFLKIVAARMLHSRPGSFWLHHMRRPTTSGRSTLSDAMTARGFIGWQPDPSIVKFPVSLSADGINRWCFCLNQLFQGFQINIF